MSIAGHSSNAILSKAHAMYGQRLTKSDFNSMLECEAVSDVMVYLKTHTRYADILATYNESAMHREQLEPLLKQHLFYDFASLCRYEISVGEKFARYLIEQIEIEQIIMFLTLLNSGRSEEYTYSLPQFFDKKTEIDLHRFPKVRTYTDFLELLGKSRYFDILKPFEVVEGERLDIAGIEHALYTDMYASVIDIIKNHTSGSSQKELYKLFLTHIDMLNFLYIHRLKKFYRLSSEEIKKYLFPFGKFTDKQLNALCNASGTDEIFKIMLKTESGHIIPKIKYNYAYEILQRSDYKLAKHYMTFSINPIVVMMSYIILMKIEISNIVNIIEGIRYKAPVDQIRQILYIN